MFSPHPGHPSELIMGLLIHFVDSTQTSGEAGDVEGWESMPVLLHGDPVAASGKLDTEC